MQRVSRPVRWALAGLLLSTLVFTRGPANAAASSLTLENRMLGWRGDKFNGSVPDPSKCDFGPRGTCGSYYFSLNIPQGYWDGHRGSLGVRVSWVGEDDDFNLYVYRAKKLIKTSRQRRSTSESITLKSPSPGTYRVIVVPFRVTDSGYGAYTRLKVAPPPPTTPYYPAPSSIRSDCSRDVTAALLRWIASVPDYSTLSFSRGGCYRIDESLTISDRWGLTFQGNGATFRAMTDGDPLRSHFWFWGGGKLAIRNLTVIGANPRAGIGQDAYRPDREWQHAFSLNGVNGAVLDNVRAYDVYGDFVFLAHDTRLRELPWAKNVIVQNSTFERNGRQGISIVAAENVKARWNYIAEVRWAMFDIEPGVGVGARHIAFTNNVTGRGLLPWFANAGEDFLVSDINVVRNFMIFKSGGQLVVVKTREGGQRGPYHFAYNDLIVPISPRAAFEFTRASNVTIVNNTTTFLFEDRMTAVKLQAAQQVRVAGNYFKGALRIIEADPESEYSESGNES